MRSDNKPVIGISTFWKEMKGRRYATLSHYYNQSVIRAGGIPVMVPLLDSTESAADYVSALDGLILSGGDEDVAPSLFGEEPIPELQAVLPERDRWEIALIDAALKQKKPVLGICRGLQIINVAMKGTLYQNIGAQLDKTIGHFPKETPMHYLWHNVQIEKGSRLEKIFGVNELMTNSFHNVAVKDTAPGFRVTARTSDGVVEAIESTEEPYLIAVQWHPEALTGNHPEFIKLFRSLVEAAGKDGK